MAQTCPPEVLQIILAHLTKNDAYTCMTVCKSWYSVSSKFYYENLPWKRTFNQNHVQLVSTTRIDGRTFGKYVKHLDFRPYSYLSRNDFITLLNNLPNLKKISIQKHLMEYLGETPENQLNCIQEISLTDDWWPQQYIDTNFPTNLQLRTEIAAMRNTFSWNFRTNGVYKDFLQALSTFKRLQHLTMHTHTDDEECINISSIINHCSNLVTLRFACEWNWYLGTTENLIQTNLSSITLKVPNFGQQHMEYLMRCLPNVKKFDLNVVDHHFEGLVSGTRRATLKKFAKYLGQMEDLVIRTGCRTEDFDIPPDLITFEIQAFWRFMRNMCDKESFCDLTVHTDHSSPVGTFITKQKQNLVMELDLPVNDEDILVHLQQLEFFTYKSLKIQGDEEDAPDNWSLYNKFIQPFIQVLLQQQNRQVCPIQTNHIRPKLKFNNPAFHPNVDQSIKYGSIERFKLQNNMLTDLAQLYPVIEHLKLERCIFDKSKNVYQLDLSMFVQLVDLTINFEASFDTKEPFNLYIQLIGRKKSKSIVYSYYSENDADILEYLGDGGEVSIPESVHLIQIHHEQIENLSFYTWNTNK